MIVCTNEIAQTAGTSLITAAGRVVQRIYESPCATASKHTVQNCTRELEEDGTPLSCLNRHVSVTSKYGVYCFSALVCINFI